MSINFIVAIKTTVAEKLTVGGEFKNLKPVNMTNGYTEMNTTPILS